MSCLFVWVCVGLSWWRDFLNVWYTEEKEEEVDGWEVTLILFCDSTSPSNPTASSNLDQTTTGTTTNSNLSSSS